MANYTFETMSQSDASAFTSADYLFFLSGSVANLGVSDTPQSVTVVPQAVIQQQNAEYEYDVIQ